MTILTRIKNNQVTDNTIEFQKLKDGTLVGSKFNANLTLNSNVTILGNLTVANSFAQLNSINTYINDPIVVFNNNYTSSPSYDIGMLINRNLSSLAPWGAVNAAWVWKEASAAFEGVMTTETGTTAGAINRTGFANLFIGNVGANTLVIRDTTTSLDYQSGAFVVVGASGFGGNVNVNGTSRFASNVVMYSGVQSTDVNTGALVVKGGTGITGNLNVGGSFNVTGSTVITGNLTVLGASTTLGTSDLAVIDSVINLHTVANLAPWTVNDGKDIGIKFHYYDGVDSHAFLGRANDTKFLEWYGAGTEGNGNVFTGSVYGTIKAGEFFSANATNSTSATTGAVRTDGGLGVAANVFLGNAVTINSTKTAGQDFKVKGKNDETLIWARPSATYDAVIIGNSAVQANVATGAKLQIYTTDSILLPVGSSAQRPSSAGGTDVTGMFRYNTTNNGLEYYGASAWIALTTQFTVITSETFNGDGTTVAFTMAGTSTTAATVVAINGVLQIPTTAYSVSGTTLTFTEAPAVGDLIDVRRLTTTATVTQIASTNGFMQISVDNDGIYIGTGTSALATTTSWNPNGAEVNLKSNVSIVIDNGDTVIDSFFANTYSGAEYTVTSTLQNTSIREIAKILAVHNGTTATISTYGVISTSGNILSNFTANIVSGNLRLYANTTNSNTIVRVDSVYQAI
jgi:hypothetical protein